MSDIGFDALGNFIANVLIASFFLFAVPAGVWVMAGLGVHVRPWILTTVKALTLLFGLVLFLVILGLAAIFNK